jgi:uncharacterized protein YfaS (alpha-2-macroglobulin family)
MIKPSVIRIFVLLSLFPIIQCGKQKQQADEFNPAFTEKIAAFTSGTISSESPVRIILAEDNPEAGEINSPAANGLFRFKPEIKGHTVWADKRTLEFRPAEKLKSGQNYHVRFNLGDVTEVDKSLSVFEFDFSVVNQEFGLVVNGYQTMNENDLVWNRIKGVVSTSDNIDYEEIKKFFFAQQDSRKLTLLWQPGDDRRTFLFTIDSVKRTEKPETVRIKWDATSEYENIKGSSETEIPSLSDYKVLDVRINHQPEQFIEIMFSDPVKKNQSFDGLIYLDDGVTLEYSVTGNIIKAFPAARLTGDSKLTIAKGLLNILGYELKEPYSANLTFEVPKPAVRLTGRGVILPASRGMVFPFEAVNLKAVDVKIIKIFENNIGHFLQVNRLDGNYELKRAGKLVHREKVILEHSPVDLAKWNRFNIDLASLIEPDQGAIYRIEISFRKSYSMYPCDGSSEEATEEDDFEEEEEIQNEASYWDSYEDYYDEYYYGYNYDWEQRDNPCSDSYYTSEHNVARNILASDLGIVAKSGSDGNLFCAVNSLITSDPLQGVEVTVYSYQQQIIGSGTTDNNGFVTIAVKEKPFLLVAKSDKQRGYLRVDAGSSLSLGAFDVAGKTVPKGLKAFLYGERGVWRPGDTLFLTCIVEDKQSSLPENHPVVFELLNPKGQLYSRATRTSGIAGFYTWDAVTSADALTGNYTLRVKIGGTSFTKTLKIESIKPNRLKINIDFNSDLLTSQLEVRGNMKVTWLHGALASGLKTVVTATLTTSSATFEKYASYQFTDPAKRFESEEQTIIEGNLNERGELTIPGHFDTDLNSPGMLNANFTTRVFEKSGDFSIDRFTIPYSPYASYAGLKTPEGDRRGMLLTDTSHWVDVVIVDEKGNPVSRNNVEAYVYKLHWRNWWESSENDLANFIGNTYNRPVFSTKIQVVGGKGRFSFRVNHPEWGRFYIRVVDPVSRHSAGKIVYLDWPGWAGRPMRDNPEAASLLMFNTDKKKYQVGEMAEVIIPASATGNALLSIENGSRILSTQWLNVNSREIRHKFEITSAMTPNVYVHVTLIQPHATSENDMPMRLYGVIPVFVEDPATRLNPVIKMPSTLEPMQNYTVEVHESNSKGMTYTLAVVEEGLLDLTRYKTPDPWTDFYAREALGIRTWDLYDMVIGAFGGKLASTLGIGGDEAELNAAAAEKANRFKPVVKFLGPFTLKAGRSNSHSLVMPNYVGSVRVMVIAGQSGAYGIAENTVQVKKPLMVLATLPRVLGPGESVRLPVTVFAMDQQIKQVSLNIKTNNLLIAEETSKTVEFERSGEKIVDFDLQVAQKTGVARVTVTATSGRNTSTYEIELNVRNANPPVTTFAGTTADAGKTAVLTFALPGMPGTNTAILEVSSIPPIDINRRLRYLLNYPHGCAEQITSAVFPQLFLTDIIDLESNLKNEIAENVKAGINKLREFQQTGGGFSYWPGQTYYNSWSSSYAGHFLLEAEKKGYAVPASLKSAWIKSQRQLARQWSPQKKEKWYQEDLEQAYRLYTLALAGEPEMSAMNRLREYSALGRQAKWRLAAAYALSGQKTAATELIARETTDIQPYIGMYSSYGSRERDWAMILETFIIMDDKLKAAALAKKISEALSSPLWMSTQSTAYCLMAMAKFAEIGNSSGKIQFAYSFPGSGQKEVVSAKPFVQIPLKGKLENISGISIINKGQGLIFTRLIMEGIPAAGSEKEFANGLSLDISYFNSKGDALDVTRITQGTDFIAKVTVYNAGEYYYRDLALTQIFPPGWEITNNRMWDNELAENRDNPAYQDIRDDRVYSYFDLAVGQRKTFTVMLNASYLGKYYLTGVYCEAMYDNSVSAMKEGQWVEVNPAGN